MTGQSQRNGGRRPTQPEPETDEHNEKVLASTGLVLKTTALRFLDWS